MPTDAATRWIAAGEVLARDPTVRVRCPEKDDGFLAVHDEALRGEARSVERYLVCEACGARNVIRKPARRERE